MDTNNNNAKVMELAGREVIVHENAEAIVCRGCHLVLFGDSAKEVVKKAKEQGWTHIYSNPYCGGCSEEIKKNKKNKKR